MVSQSGRKTTTELTAYCSSTSQKQRTARLHPGSSWGRSWMNLTNPPPSQESNNRIFFGKNSQFAHIGSEIRRHHAGRINRGVCRQHPGETHYFTEKSISISRLYCNQKQSQGQYNFYRAIKQSKWTESLRQQKNEAKK